YRKALEAKHHPSIIFNIGQCHRQLENWKKALFSYQLFLSERPNASNRTEVEQWIAAMKAAIAKQQAANAPGKVSITSTPSGATIHVDQPTGRPAGTSPAVLTLKQGAHVLFLSLAGYQRVQRFITVKANKIAAINFALPKKVAASTVGRISVTTTPSGATIHVDNPTGKPAGTSPMVLSLRHGEHVLFFTMAGHRNVQRVVKVKPNAIVAVDVTIAPIASPAKSRPAAIVQTPIAPKRHRYKPYRKRWWFKMGVSLTSVFGGLAIGLGSVVLHYYRKDWQDPNSVHDLSTYHGLRNLAAVVDGLIGAAALSAIGTTIGAILVWRKHKRKEKQKRTTLITPTCGPGGCGVLVQGRF
ncbi:MAG: PEGA domain-containing protein, partial [Deltaproteobacteria bacterium]|nr:PEGA domain-containing protein [Deltaproteobacteria bacterium]